MNKLIAELQRLYFFPDGPLGADTFAALELVSADGQVRAMCIDFKKSTAVSYTHLDVYKRQPFEGLNSVFLKQLARCKVGSRLRL